MVARIPREGEREVKREKERSATRGTGLSQSPGERSAELMVCDGYDGFAGSGGRQ